MVQMRNLAESFNEKSLPCVKDSDTQKLVFVGGTDASEVVEVGLRSKLG